jgi:hypothetical protein
MIDFPNEMTMLLVLFLVVFALNVIPAFAPPTWMTLSFIRLTIPSVHVVSLAVVGATAATFGRVVLAKLSRVIIRQKILSEEVRLNVDAIKQGIESRKALTSTVFIAFALSPLPSNYLFIAYGMTALPIALLALPFFVGRVLSYSFWVMTASALGDRLNLDAVESASYFGVYFIVSQLLLVPVMYGFARVDWHAAFAERKFKLFEKSR